MKRQQPATAESMSFGTLRMPRHASDWTAKMQQRPDATQPTGRDALSRLMRRRWLLAIMHPMLANMPASQKQQRTRTIRK
jgi:hypothetical protein